MKKILGVISIVLVLILMQLILPYSGVCAAADIISDANAWFRGGMEKGLTYMNPGTVAQNLAPISQILFWAGVITLLIAFSVMGIKYMTGDPEKKGEQKAQLIGLVVAAVVILGAYTIWKLTYMFMSEVVNL